MTNRIDMAVLTDAELAAVTGGNALTQPTINGLQLPLGPGPELFPTSAHAGPLPFGPGPVIFPGAGQKAN